MGEFAQTGWLAYPPLSGQNTVRRRGRLLDLESPALRYWYHADRYQLLRDHSEDACTGHGPVQDAGIHRAALCTNVLIIAAFPVLTVTLALLTLDRYLDFHFFTNDMGGNMMMYVNLIWVWGHPEVYILVLPVFGVFSEVTATFSKKRLFGYTSLVWATIAITVLSFIVWLHHFTMGAGANVNAFFGIMTMIIAIPTGVKIFNWLFTMYQVVSSSTRRCCGPSASLSPSPLVG